MARVVIINGFPGAGKDTFVDLCRKSYENTHNIHTSDEAKEALMALGWDGVKTPATRKLLADLMEFSYRFGGPVYHAISTVSRISKTDEQLERSEAVVFVHVREWGNVQKFKRTFPGSITLFIEREEAENQPGNNRSDLEAGENRETYDFTVHNNSSLQALKYSAQAFMIVARGRKTQ